MIVRLAGGPADATHFGGALEVMARERIALAVDCDALLAGVLHLADDPTTAGKPLGAGDLFGALSAAIGNRQDFDFTLRDHQRLGIALRQLRDRAAGLVRIETQRTSDGVRYVISTGR